MSGRLRIVAGAAVALVLIVAVAGWTHASSVEHKRSQDQEAASTERIALNVKLRKAQRDLADAKTQLDSATEAVNTLDQQVHGNNEQNRATKLKLAQLQTTLKAQSDGLDQRQAQLDQLSVDLTTRNADLAQKSAALDAREASLNARQAEQDARQAQLDAYAATLTQQAAA